MPTTKDNEKLPFRWAILVQKICIFGMILIYIQESVKRGKNVPDFDYEYFIYQ